MSSLFHKLISFPNLPPPLSHPTLQSCSNEWCWELWVMIWALISHWARLFQWPWEFMHAFFHPFHFFFFLLFYTLPLTQLDWFVGVGLLGTLTIHNHTYRRIIHICENQWEIAHTLINTQGWTRGKFEACFSYLNWVIWVWYWFSHETEQNPKTNFAMHWWIYTSIRTSPRIIASLITW